MSTPGKGIEADPMATPGTGYAPVTTAQPPAVGATVEDPWAPLVQTDMLLIEQEMSLMETVTNGLYEAKNKYRVYTGDGNQQFYAMEESSCCCRCCCGPHADMKLHVKAKDQTGPDVFMIEKPYKCCCPVLGSCCQKEATVKLTNGETIGFVQQPCLGGGCTPVINVFDKQGGELQSVLTGPFCCVGGICCDSKFTLKDKAGQPMGEFSRKGAKDLRSMGRILASDSDKYTMTFNAATDVKVKATMIGTLLFLDYLFFEGDGAVDCSDCSIKFCDLVCCGAPCPCKCSCKSDS